MNDPNTPMDDLDRYLDGLMPEDEAEQFRRRAERDPALRDALRTQASIDASLVRLAEPGGGEARACVDAIHHESSPPEPLPIHRADARPWWLRTGALAALIALAGFAAWVWLADPFAPPGGTYDTPRIVAVAAVFEREQAGGFEPDWLCETDEEFRATFAERLGQPVSMRPLPEDRAMLGLSYLARGRGETVVMLAQAQGQPVLVFFDRPAMLEHYELDPPDGMTLHRGRAGALEVIELSPLDQPVFLDYLTAVD